MSETSDALSHLAMALDRGALALERLAPPQPSAIVIDLAHFRAARDVPIGAHWNFPGHRTMAQVNQDGD